ncbi:MAG TPA: efflux RND transporter periplasmic adaptor subunit [Fimbriimonadaceae bacterium]|nr:efflux RND transporter periplasmic adaptor subunit [Fimbriimonadaceae bacterium]
MLAIACLSVLTLAGCGKGGAAADSGDDTPKAVVEVSVGQVTRGTIRSTLSVTGTLAPLPDQEAKIAPLAPGRIKSIFVRTGDQVRKGQTIAMLDPGPAAGQVQQAQAALRVAEETLSQAKVNLTSQLRTQSASVEQAQLNVQAQSVALQKLKAGSRPQEIAQARAGVVSAQAALTNAELNLSRSQTLFRQGLLARKDLEAAQEDEATARAGLTTARQALSLAEQGNRPEDIRAGEVALAQAQQQLRAAQQQSIQNQSKEQDVRIAQAQVAEAQGALQSAFAQARSLAIVSPVAGTVTGRTVNAGESVDVTTAIATVVNLDRVRVLLGVPSDQIAAVHKGDLVEFTTDQDPIVKHLARVTVINRSVDPASNTVQVEAVALNTDHSLRDDGFVKAVITTKTDAGAVLGPAAAIVQKDEKTLVYLAQPDGTAKAQEVKLGAKEGDRVEILSGLSPGETVVTTGAYELDDGTEIKVAK